MKRRDFFGVAGGAAAGCLFPASSAKAEESVKPTLEGMTDEEMAKFLSEQTLQKVNFDGPNYRKWLTIHDPRIWMYTYVTRSESKCSIVVNSPGEMHGCIDLQPGSRTSVNMIKAYSSGSARNGWGFQTFWRLDNGWFAFNAPWQKRRDRITLTTSDPDIIDGRVDRSSGGVLFDLRNSYEEA